MNKSEYLMVRVSPEDKARFKRLAESRKMNLSDLMRTLLEREAKK